jgi:hypothetical protein
MKLSWCSSTPSSSSVIKVAPSSNIKTYIYTLCGFVLRSFVNWRGHPRNKIHYSDPSMARSIKMFWQLGRVFEPNRMMLKEMNDNEKQLPSHWHNPETPLCWEAINYWQFRFSRRFLELNPREKRGMSVRLCVSLASTARTLHPHLTNGRINKFI